MSTYTKKYYSISEAVNMLNTPDYVLRYWEQQFDILNPPTSKGGHRRYRPEDLELIMEIKHLVYDKGLSIEAANRFLNESRKPFRNPKCNSPADALKCLAAIKEMVADNPKGTAILSSIEKWVDSMTEKK